MNTARRPRAVEGVLSFGAWIWICLMTVFWTLLMAVFFAIHPVFDPNRKILHRFAGFWGRGLVTSAPGCRVVVSGAENLPEKGPVILMANHQSYVDVPSLYFIRHQFKWMADSYLFRIPFFGWAMRMAGYVPVDRTNVREGVRALRKAEEWTKKGISVFLFPEGTRSRTGVFGRFQTGGFRLAASTGLPIVPVVVVGTRQLLPRKSWVFRLRVTLQIHILPPVSLQPGLHARQSREAAVRLRAQMARVYRDGLKKFGERATMKK